MWYPTLSEQQTSRQMTETFKGYNHNIRIGNGEFYDMKNMTSTHFPVLSPRDRRGIYAEPEKLNGIIAKDELCYVDGSDFIVGEERVAMELSDSTKTLVSFGAYVIILPDKKYINTADLTDFGNIEETMTTSGKVTFQLSRIDGSEYEDITVADKAPASPANLALWIDTSSVPHALKQYSESTSTWVVIATTYIKISAPGIGIPFEVYDGVTIDGITVEALKDLNATFTIQAKGDDYIVVTGIADEVLEQEDPITIKRAMPTMDFLTEANNRLWGCRYGEALNGEQVNEIYACKLGDFKNWNCFMGVSTDSYAASCGTDGPFTGAITHMGYPLFFKESCLHKVYGSYPANYQIQVTECRGVQEGCGESLAIVNEILYYKARSAICAYDGSLPVEIGSQLGEERYSEALAGAHRNKYYLCMKDSEGKKNLFVYDTAKGLWHKEDDEDIIHFCPSRDEMYYIADGKIKTMLGSGTLETEPIEWMVETGLLGTSMIDKKYISKITVRMSLELGAEAIFELMYDSSGSWEHVATMAGTSLRSFSVPIRPRRCDHFKLRIRGKGGAKIFSWAKTYEQGSDI